MNFLNQLAITFGYGLLVLFFMAVIMGVVLAIKLIFTMFPMAMLVLVFIVIIFFIGIGYRLVVLDEFWD